MFSQISFSQEEANIQEFPNMFVSKLKMKKDMATYSGTGIIINENTLLTNAHNVYGKDSIIIYLGHQRNKINPLGEIKIKCEIGKNVFYSDKFDANDVSYDFAVVKFSNPKIIENLLKLSFGKFIEIQNFKNINELHITGYPVYRWFEFKSNNGEVQYYNSTKTFNLSNKNLLINYKLNTRGGSSGSPLWIISENKYYIVGIHKSGKIKNNQGILYDEERLKLIKQWASLPAN